MWNWLRRSKAELSRGNIWMCWLRAPVRIAWPANAFLHRPLFCSNVGNGEKTLEVEMKIRGLMMDPMTNMPIVVLKDLSGDAVLPIWVGIYEANAIALEIEKVTTPRPMTHDLIKVVLMG